MTKGLSGVKTLTAKQIADKWKLPLSVVAKKIEAGIKVEKEHTTSIKQANEIARDHLGERPDYYEKLHKMEKQPVVREETVTAGIGGLGFNTGTPAIDADNGYIDTNSMSYDDVNGAILKMIKDKHDRHLVDMGFTSYSPNDLQNASNSIVKEAKHPLQANFDKYRKGELNELGEYDNKGGTIGAEGLTDAPPKKDVKEGWASIGHPYDRFGDVNRRAKFSGSKPKPTTTKSDEKDDTYKDSKQGGTNVNKVKPVRESAILTGMALGGLAGTAAAPFVAKGVNKALDYLDRKKEQKYNDDLKTKREKARSKRKTVKEDAVTVAATQHMDAARTGEYRPSRGVQSRVNFRGNTAHVKGAEYRSGTGSARASFGTGGQMKPSSTNVPTRFMRSVKNAPTTQGAGGQMKPTNTSGTSSFTPNSQSRSMNVGKGMAASKQTSPVVKGMADAGRAASAAAAKAAPTAAKIAGGAVRALTGPAATAVASVMAPQPAGERKSEFQRQADVAKGISYKAQGRSEKDYEAQVLTPKSYKAPENPKVNAPTPPSRPEYFTRGQAFSAARKDASDGEGKFSYQGGSEASPKTYQTNVTGEPYKPEKQLKQTSVQENRLDELKAETLGSYIKKASASRKEALNKEGGAKADVKTWGKRQKGITTAFKKLTNEETKMENKSLINEAIESIVDNDLNTMKENLMVALQEKAMEKLEERKKEIAANYFAE